MTADLRDLTTLTNRQLGAYLSESIPLAGNSVVILESSYSDLQIGFNDGPLFTVSAGLQLKLPEGSQFSSIRVANPNGGTLTYSIGIAFGEIIDRRLNVSGALLISSIQNPVAIAGSSTYDEGPGRQTLAAGASYLPGAHADRVRALIEADAINPGPLNLCQSASVNNGLQLWPGEKIDLRVTGTFRVFNGNASTCYVRFTMERE